MAEGIIQQTKKLPRATAKEKDGIVLYWIDDLDEAGLHLNGIARMLGCSTSQVLRAIEASTQITSIEAEIITDKGIQPSTLYLGRSVSKILRAIARSGIKDQSIKDLADDIRDRLAEAGFKLAVMMELAPEKLAAQAIANSDEKEILKLRKEVLALEDKTLSLRHYVVTALPKADADRVLGVKEIETTKIKEVPVNERGQIIGHIPGDSLNKTELCHRYGILTRTGKPDYKQISAYIDGLKLPGDAWEDRMIVSHNAQLKVEYLPRLDALLGKVDRQQYLGEQGERSNYGL